MDRLIMQSLNFEFIRPHRPELADLGGLAEYHLYVDSDMAVWRMNRRNIEP